MKKVQKACRSNGWFTSTDNPMHTLEVRLKQSADRRGRGEGKAYRKLLGRHEHRAVAERMLGRPLAPGEIVHHIDGDKFNNDPGNLAIVDRREHALIHLHNKPFRRREGGDTDATK